MPYAHSKALILTMLATLLTFGSSEASPIDFEDQPVGTSVATQYQPTGVLFSSPGNPSQPEINSFSGNSTTGNVLADYSIIGGIQLDANFTTPISAISAIVYANPSYVVTMRAYDSSNTLVGSQVSAGGSYNQGTLSLAGIGPVSRVTWTTGSDIAAVGIDNLTFTLVPEPATGSMWAIFLVGSLLRCMHGRTLPV